MLTLHVDFNTYQSPPTQPDNTPLPLDPPPITCTWLPPQAHPPPGATPAAPLPPLLAGDDAYGWSVQEEVAVRGAVLGVLHAAQGGGVGLFGCFLVYDGV